MEAPREVSTHDRVVTSFWGSSGGSGRGENRGDAPREINAHDHVIISIWGSSGGGGVGHVAANIHFADYNSDNFVSLWPGYEADESLIWQKDFQEVFEAEHYHAPTTVLVFYTLDVLSMMGRYNALCLQTESWVMNLSKEESLDPEARRHNCCTAVWNVLKAGRICGDEGILSESDFKSVLSTANMNLPVRPAVNHRLFWMNLPVRPAVNRGPSTLTWEALLSGERYGPDMLFEILTKAKKKEVEKMVADDPHDVRLMLRFGGHEGLKGEGGFILKENDVGAETEAFSTPTLRNACAPKPK
jgi:hypothetical protein